jgi:hypothetical protein
MKKELLLHAREETRHRNKNLEIFQKTNRRILIYFRQFVFFLLLTEKKLQARVNRHLIPIYALKMSCRNSAKYTNFHQMGEKPQCPFFHRTDAFKKF